MWVYQHARANETRIQDDQNKNKKAPRPPTKRRSPSTVKLRKSPRADDEEDDEEEGDIARSMRRMMMMILRLMIMNVGCECVVLSVMLPCCGKTRSGSEDERGNSIILLTHRHDQRPGKFIMILRGVHS